jgi:caffeoyl-CoA O-methyltransferase
MSELISLDAEGYALAHTSALTGPLAGAADWTLSNTPWPGMMSGLAELRLLQALIVAGGARRVLEIGTFTGVGTVGMAAALPEGGRVITLEFDEAHAEIAHRHIDASGLGDRIELIVGDALETLRRLDGPFDLVYVDAAKEDYPGYYEAVVPKLAPRGVIVADNLFRAGAVLDDTARDLGTRRMREFTDLVQADDRTDNVLLTVGDGLMLAWRKPAAG